MNFFLAVLMYLVTAVYFGLMIATQENASFSRTLFRLGTIPVGTYIAGFIYLNRAIVVDWGGTTPDLPASVLVFVTTAGIVGATSLLVAAAMSIWWPGLCKA